MPNGAEKLDRTARLKPSPSETTGLPASLDCDLTLRQLISEAISNSLKSREQIADEMSYLIGSARITTPMLNCYTAESKEKHRFPLAFLPAFCQVTGDRRALECVARLAGAAVLDPAEQELAELGALVVASEAGARDVEARKQRILSMRRHGGTEK